MTVLLKRLMSFTNAVSTTPGWIALVAGDLGVSTCELFRHENVGKLALAVAGPGSAHWKGPIEGMVVANGGIVNALTGVEAGALGGE